jgi:hypothetical protein
MARIADEIISQPVRMGVARVDEARADFAVRQLLDLGEMVAGPDPCVADRDLRDRNVDLVLARS